MNSNAFIFSIDYLGLIYHGALQHMLPRLLIFALLWQKFQIRHFLGSAQFWSKLAAQQTSCKKGAFGLNFFLPHANCSMSTAHGKSGAKIIVQEPQKRHYLNLAVSTDTVDVGEPFHVSFRVRPKDANGLDWLGDLSICIVAVDLYLAVERLQLEPKKVVLSRAVAGDYFCSTPRRFPFTPGRRKILVDDVVPLKERTCVPIIAAQLNSFFVGLFPRASERRVLLMVGVCETSSHLHIFSSSHLIFTYLPIFSSSHPRIFTSVHLHIFFSSHPHIFTSSHLHILTSSHLLIITSSHLDIFSSSHLHILSCPLALLPSCSLLLFYFSLEGAGQCQRDATKCNPFARNEVRSPKTEVKLRFLVSGRNPFARNDVRSPKN